MYGIYCTEAWGLIASSTGGLGSRLEGWVQYNVPRILSAHVNYSLYTISLYLAICCINYNNGNESLDEVCVWPFELPDKL